MSLPIYYYVLGTPLGLIGLIRWGCWLVRRIPAALYRPVTGSFRLPMTVVVPVYQEDPDVFTVAIESWLANDVEEVILVIDSSDEICREVAGRYPVRVLITDVPGKRDALRRGWTTARTELVALVDSDTVWAPDVAVEVCQPFADPRIGGVGTRQNVYGSTGFLSRITDMFLDHRYFDENAGQTRLGRAVSCLSGRTAIYRRALLLEIEHEFMNETFWGVPCLSGDDKRLTTLILERRPPVRSPAVTTPVIRGAVCPTTASPYAPLPANSIFGSQIGVLLKGTEQKPNDDNELRANRDGDVKVQ